MATSVPDRTEQLRIRDLICGDYAALAKWANLVDQLAPLADDSIRIKRLLANSDHREAILQTIALCNSSTSLVQVLREHGLNGVADKIALPALASVGGSHMWFEVAELPHDFSGRDTQLALVHRRLTEFHSLESVEANIVCLSGEADCGKSTVARKYAFKNSGWFEGNVMWIRGESAEAMRGSFTRLAHRLGVPFEPAVGDRQLAESVYNYFTNKKCLFIFDDVCQAQQFNGFKPRITNPYNTPYMLVTSRYSDWVPIKRNVVKLDMHAKKSDEPLLLDLVSKLKIARIRSLASAAPASVEPGPVMPMAASNMLSSIQDSNVHAGCLARLLAYLDPDNITVQFLETLQQHVPKTSSNLETCIKVLESKQLVKMGVSKLVVSPTHQAEIRASLTAGQEEEALSIIRKAHNAVSVKTNGGRVPKDLRKEFTTHRLQPLQFQLLSTTVVDYIRQVCDDLLRYDQDKDLETFTVRATEILAERHGTENETAIYAGFRAVECMGMADEFSEAIDALKQILPDARTALGKDHELTLDILGLMNRMKGIEMLEKGKFDQAMDIFDEEHEKLEARVGLNDVRMADLTVSAAAAFAAKGKVRQALELLREAHRVYKSKLGETHALTLDVKVQLGELLGTAAGDNPEVGDESDDDDDDDDSEEDESE